MALVRDLKSLGGEKSVRRRFDWSRDQQLGHGIMAVMKEEWMFPKGSE